MKKKVVRICLLLTLAAALTTAARAQTPEYKTHIPFDFNVGSKRLPAGEYVIALVDYIESRNVLTIRETKSNAAQTVMFSPKSSKEAIELSEIAFNRYDEQYFLTEIISPGIYGEFTPTSAEKRLAENQTPERVTIAITK